MRGVELKWRTDVVRNACIDHVFSPANTNEVFYDFRKNASLELWSDACIAMTKTGYVDGCFADGAMKVEAPVAKDIHTDFLTRKQSMLKVISSYAILFSKSL